jgi:endonuclease III
VSPADTIQALLDRHGQTYAEELGVKLGGDAKPADLFRLLVAAILFSARIDAGIAVKAAQELRRWRTARAMAGSTWEERVQRLHAAGYTRYQERTATMLGDTAEFLLDRYRGDLRRLRDDAERDPDRERKALTEIKGIGDVGADIFFREAQVAWEELYPFADRRALDAARRLGLPNDADGLARATDGDRSRFARVVAALVRTELADDFDAIR